MYDIYKIPVKTPYRTIRLNMIYRLSDYDKKNLIIHLLREMPIKTTDKYLDYFHSSSKYTKLRIIADILAILLAFNHINNSKYHIELLDHVFLLLRDREKIIITSKKYDKYLFFELLMNIYIFKRIMREYNQN